MVGVAKNIMIGIFIVIALAIIVFMLLFLHPSVGDNAKVLTVLFTDIDKVNIGTRVTYAGRPVGEVINIEELPDARTGRQAVNGDVYVYKLTLQVDSGVSVYNTDEIAIRTSGLLGERNIAIDPQPLKPGQKLILVDDQTLYAEQTGSVDDTIKQFGELSKKFDQVLEGILDMINDVKKEEVIAKISKTIENVSDITEALNEPDKWKGTLQNVWNLTERAHDTWTTVDRSVNNIDHLTENAKKSWPTVDRSLQDLQIASVNTKDFTGQIKEVIDNTSRGKGTVGQLFVSNDLYLRLKSVLSKGETTMNDINHYGILFHLNKDWQRLNARRLNLLQKLSDPCQFAMYFNDELDQIHTSLSRVSMVLNEAECYPQPLLYNSEYIQKFGDLLRKVEGVEETLKMYNQQVVDQGQDECCTRSY